MALLPYLERETQATPDACVIWLHGLGANGHDFYPIVPELKQTQQLNVRFVFPHAPSMPVTINNGFVMPAWYDITDINIDRKIDETQLRQSAAAVNELIQEQINKGIAANRIIIAGFSQGGAVALESALSHPSTLGGLLAMSTYFATKDSIQLSSENQSIPIEVHHGLYDVVVPEQLGQETVKRLQHQGYACQYRTYPMEHAVCPAQILDIDRFFVQCLS
ncbi:alpha/beta hydrolase [Pleionea litopenaei]|uniref:Dienelactone hydrolase family protein n=1 Tax=Pleionea litopenaei TaxID=3070815 RepID=A0AA51RTT6_9GAMM|nr:dienelactone hydrolase family protein [Pleionea sp. HL-JVS1]WMS87364.1 dienelactone hydrolase family protein [Pleionea sp. HL-JVS1]